MPNSRPAIILARGLLGSWWTPSKRTLGVVMAFGAGVLISAVSYELVFEAIHLAKLAGIFTVLGFAVSVWVIVLERSAAG
jgi:zinc transporter ZupT